MGSPFQPSGFFALRTPLRSFDALRAWSEGLEAPALIETPSLLEAALARDRARLRAWLDQALEQPVVLEALFLASPSLVEAIPSWRAAPDNRKGRQAEHALVRYLQRMSTRPTPFGLFSGCSVGRVGAGPTELSLQEQGRYLRHSRLDMDYLFALCEALGRDPAIRESLRYRPNSSLYTLGGRLRFTAARLNGNVRAHHLVALEPTVYLQKALTSAAAGATLAELAEGLIDDEVSRDEAVAFVHQLVDAQLLVADLTPNVTGPEPVSALADALSAIPAGAAAAQALRTASAALTAMDQAGLGRAPGIYRTTAEGFAGMPARPDLSRLFQVDMTKPGAGLSLGPRVVAELQRGLGLMHRLFGQSKNEALARFRQSFVERYGEDVRVPLLEALDEELGVGFEKSTSTPAEASPLLRGLGLAPPRERSGERFSPTLAWLLRKLETALAAGETEIEVDEGEVARLELDAPLPLPDALQVVAVISARSAADVERSRFELLFRSAFGPSGVKMLARFCHADPELTARVHEHLRAEEATAPHALFAEVVHLPEGRTGNILSRPLLRQHEIPFLGRSGAPPERQLALSDLVVSVENSRVVLRSVRLDVEVLPRLSSAHNFTRGIGLYRFLCALQTQAVQGGVEWSWGPLEAMAFLPRVRSGRLVLCRARWRMESAEIRALTLDDDVARFAAVQRWRRQRGLPRHVVLADFDNELLVDFDNALSVDGWLDLLGERQEASLVELYPSGEGLCAEGPEGAFTHELVVPFVRSEAAPRPAVRALTQPAPVPGAPSGRRAFAPGSEWLFAKLYVGTSTADVVLRDTLGPLVRKVIGSGAARSWFFIRYGDPHWHLRVRFHGAPQRLLADVLPQLSEAVRPLLEDGRLWRFTLDTYEREVERYGGPHGVEWAERFFCADSEAALDIVEHLEGDAGAEARWQLALRGTDLLLRDLGLDTAQRHLAATHLRDAFFREFGAGKPLRMELDAKRRSERRGLEQMLSPQWSADSPLAPGLAALERRSVENRALAAELRELERGGHLTQSVSELVPSLVHMHVNRLIRSSAREHELVLYDLLAGAYDSLAARSAAAKRVGRLDHR
jgi:lantibiotic biosynthesis protein